MKKINLEDLKKASQNLVKRFPVALAFLAMLTIWILLCVWDKAVINPVNVEADDSKAWITVSGIEMGTIYYYLSIAIALSIVLQFWGEEVKDRKRVLWVSIVSHVVLLADAAYLWCRPEGSIDTELLLGHAACCSALVIGGAFLPYRGEKDDLATWNLVLRMLVFSAVCPLVCLVLSSGLCLLLGSLDMLFGVNIDSNWYLTIFFLTQVALAMTLWMSRLPQDERKYRREAVTSKFLTGLVRYLFLPLVLGYLVVLYVYGAKILLAMELPRGGVCYYVNALMIGCLGIEVLLYPLLRKADAEGQGANAFERWLVRWLPVIIMPLLVLMTVAIGRRIADYGITVNRLYTLTLNLWFYAVCIGLFVTRARRIHWISLSFAALFLLTSALPVNYCTLTRQSILGRIECYFDTHQHPELPMTDNVFEEYFSQLPAEEAESLQDDLKYIRSLYSQDEVAQYIDKDVSLWRFEREEDGRLTVTEYTYEHNDQVMIPEGYHRFGHYNHWQTINGKDSSLWHIEIEDTLCVVIDMDSLPMGNDKEREWLIQDQHGSGVHYITRLSLRNIWGDSIKVSLGIEGYYFEK